MSARARRTATLSLIAATWLVGGLGLATAAHAATGLWDDFESGTASGWSSSHVDVGRSFAKSESFGARAVSNASQAGYLNWSASAVTQEMRYGRIRGWVKVVSADAGQSVDVMTLQNAAGSRHFDFFRDPWSGRWKYDLLSADSAVSTMPATFGEWYFVEALVDFGGVGGTTYTSAVRINGVDQPAIDSTEQVGTTVRAAWFGGRSLLKTNTRDYDNLRVDVANTPFPFTR